MIDDQTKVRVGQKWIYKNYETYYIIIKTKLKIDSVGQNWECEEYENNKKVARFWGKHIFWTNKIINLFKLDVVHEAQLIFNEELKELLK